MPQQGGRATDTVVQRLIGLDQPEEWKRALEGIAHSFFHTWEHSYAMHLSHGLPVLLYCAEAGGVRVVCPFLERPAGEAKDTATPYGFSGFAGNGLLPALPELWREFAQSRGYVSVFLNLHPLFFRPEWADPSSLFEQKELYVLDTRRSAEALLEGCARARRREIRQWQQEARLYRDREQLKAFVLEHYREFFLRKQATAAYDFSRETMEFLLEQKDLLLLGAGSSSELEAVNAFAVTPHCAEGLFHFSLPGGRRHSAGLMWAALLEAQRRGIPHFNLGGGLSRHDALEQFKSRFGAVPHLCFAMKQVVDPERYGALCAAAGADAEERDGYFPAYRSPALSSAMRR